MRIENSEQERDLVLSIYLKKWAGEELTIREERIISYSPYGRASSHHYATVDVILPQEYLPEEHA